MHTPTPGADERLWTRNFILISLINLFMFCGFQMFPVALPPYVKSLGATDSVLGWLVGISTLTTLVFRPVAGNLLDKAGRRPVLLFGLFVMMAASLAHYFFPMVWILLLIRGVHGVGWGLASTGTNTIAADYIPKKRFGEGMGYFSLSASIAMAVSPALALSMAAGPMIWTATLFVAVALVLALFLQYKHITPTPAPAEGTKAARPSPYERAAFMPSFIIMLTNVAYGCMVTFMALYAAQRGIPNIGSYFVVYAITLLVSRPFLGRIIDRRGHNPVLYPGLACIALALAGLSLSHSLWGFLGSAALYGVGMGGVHTSTQALAVLASPQHRIGAANATYYTGFDAGIGIGAIFGGFIAGLAGYANMFLILSLFPVASGLLFALSRQSRRK